MKTIIFTSAMFFAFGQISYSQCNPIIYPSPGCTKVSTNSVIEDLSGGCYWVCMGLNVDVDASAGSAIYCESNVTLNINASDGDQVYAKPGCIINNNSDADIGVCGDPANITMNNLGSGTITLTCSCSPLTYDYSQISGGGGSCAGISAIDEVSEILLDVYPNPVEQGSMFQIETGTIKANQIKITDLNGKMVYTANGNINTVSTAAIVPGMYFMMIELENGMKQTSRLVVY